MFELFAQAGKKNPDLDAATGGLMTMILVVSCGSLLVGLIVAIFYLLTLSKALGRCSPKNRTMEPGQVWLQLIPLFGLFWQFVVVNRIAESLRKEYRSRGWRKSGDFGQGLGTIECVLTVLSLVPFINYLTSLPALICFIIYWVKIAGFSKELASDRGNDDEDGEPEFEQEFENEEEEERPRRRKDRDEDEEEDDRPRKRR